MWTIANQLKGTIKFPGLGFEIPPQAEFDLDTIGREKAEASAQLKLALDSGYLSTVRKTMMLDESELQKIIESRIQSIKANLVSEIGELYKEKSTAASA